jgi:hypothetical protein
MSPVAAPKPTLRALPLPAAVVFFTILVRAVSVRGDRD